MGWLDNSQLGRRDGSVKISRAKRIVALLGSAIVALAAIHSVSPASADDPPYIGVDSMTYTPGANDIPSLTGRDLDLTISDPLIYDARYVTVDKLHFPGFRYQTINTGIIADAMIDTTHGLKVDTTTSSPVGGGFLFSTYGVFRSGTGLEYALVPRYGLYFGHTESTPRDVNQNATRVVIADIQDTKESNNRVLLALDGRITTTLSNQNSNGGAAYTRVTIGIGTTTTPTTPLTTVGKPLSSLKNGGVPGSIVIGGVTDGGTTAACLETNKTACDAIVSPKRGWDLESTYAGTSSYKKSMFTGDIGLFTITKNTLDAQGTVTGSDVVYQGIPAYDLMTGYCGYYDFISQQFSTAEAGHESLVTCKPDNPTLTVESVSDSPKMVFTYSSDCTQAPSTTACMTSIAGTLRLSLPPLPTGWEPGAHLFQLAIDSGNTLKITTFAVFYVPTGTLSIDKRAWMDVPAGTTFEAIVGGTCSECDEVPSGTTIPLGSDVVFTFTVAYSVLPDPQLGSWAGRYGLPDVDVTDRANNGPVTDVCTISDILVSDPAGTGVQNARGCLMREVVNQ